MAIVKVTVPGLLSHTLNGSTSTTLNASTLAELLATLKRQHPLLVPLIWDEQGTLRKHVLIFLNDTATKWMETDDVPLKDGDTVAVVQAVSGG